MAAKLTGKAGGTNLGLLSARGRHGAARASGADHPFFNILRVQRDLGGESKLGLVYTDRTDGARFQPGRRPRHPHHLGGVLSLQLQAAVSRTRVAGATHTAPLFEACSAATAAGWACATRSPALTRTSEPRAGFISRRGIARVTLDHRLTLLRAEGGGAREPDQATWCSTGSGPIAAFVGGGGLLERKLHLNNNAMLRGGWKAGASVLIESFGYDPGLYADYALWPGPARWVLPFVGTPTSPTWTTC